MQNELISFACPISGKLQAINIYEYRFCQSETFYYCHSCCPFMEALNI